MRSCYRHSLLVSLTYSRMFHLVSPAISFVCSGPSLLHLVREGVHACTFTFDRRKRMMGGVQRPRACVRETNLRARRSGEAIERAIGVAIILSIQDARATPRAAVARPVRSTVRFFRGYTSYRPTVRAGFESKKQQLPAGNYKLPQDVTHHAEHAGPPRTTLCVYKTHGAHSPRA